MPESAPQSTDRQPYDPLELEPDERSTRPAHETPTEVARGRASSTPFAVLFTVAGFVGVVAGLIIVAVLLVWLLV